MCRRITICLALAALTVGVYWPVRHHDFICFDDQEFVSQNPIVQAGLTSHGVSYALTASVADNWHPVTLLSHMLDCELFGPNPGPHHLVSAAIHAANAMLLFLLLNFMTGATWRSAIVAALFALHPLRVESVAWIAERKDVLGGFFFLLTLLAYSLAESRKQKAQDAKQKVESRKQKLESGGQNQAAAVESPLPAPRSPLFPVAALVCFTLGLMSKPMLVTLPFVLLLLDFWPLQRVRAPALSPSHTASPDLPDLPTVPALRLVLEKWRFFALSAAACWMTIRVQGQSGGIATHQMIGLGERVGNAIASYFQYLGMMVWPTRLALLYPHPGLHYPLSSPWPAWQIAIGALLLLSISALCLCQLRARPYLAVGWFWFLGTMVPVLGLVQVGEQAMADRYTYIPLIGPTFSVVWLIAELWRPGTRLALAGLALVSIAACLPLTHRQLGYWRNSVSLFEHTVENTPDNPVAQCSLGTGLVDEGKLSMGAVRFRVAVNIHPKLVLGRINLGGALRKLDLLPEAAEQYLAVTRLEPQYFPARLALVEILSGSGRTKEAAAQMDEALRLYAEQNLGAPNSPFPALTAGFLNDLAWGLATSERAENRDGTNAVRFAQRACELTHYRQTVLVGTLAAAYAETGQFAAARTTADLACTLASASGDQALLQKNQELLALYCAGKPYRRPPPPPLK